MKAPFPLPVIADGNAVQSQDGTPLLAWFCNSATESYIVQAIDNHERLTAAIARFVAAEKACLNSSMPNYAAACAERVLAMEELEAIDKELK